MDLSKLVPAENVLVFDGALPGLSLLGLLLFGLLSGPKTSRPTVILVGSGLVAVAGWMAWFVLASLDTIEHAQLDEAGQAAGQVFKMKTDLLMLIFPLLVGGIGTSLISHALTSRLIFEKPKRMSYPERRDSLT
jgi:hypothetical protein